MDATSPTDRRRHELGMLLVALLVALHATFRPDRTPVALGEAQDYRRWVTTLGDEVAADRLTAWHVSRALPSAVLHVGFRAVGVVPDEADATRAFAALNGLMALVVAFAWTRAARLLPLSPRATWVGLASLLLGYAALKEAQFRPFMTDMPALALGTLSLWCYLADRPLALAAATFAGAFVWPISLETGVLLLLLPRTPGVGPSPTRWAPPVAGAVAALALIIYIDRLLARGAIDPVAQVPPMADLFWLSTAIAALVVALGVRGLVDREDLTRPGRLAWARVARRLPLALGVVLAAKVTTSALSNGQAMPPLAPIAGLEYGPRLFLDMCVYRGIAKPGVFLLTHALYFGPLFVLLLARWSATCAALRAHAGPGLALASLGGVVLALDAESRHLLHTWPLVVPWVALATEDLWRSRATFGLVLAGSLLASRVWVPYLSTPIPWETWFHSGLGAWLTITGYTVALLVSAPAIMALVWVALRRPPPPPA